MNIIKLDHSLELSDTKVLKDKITQNHDQNPPQQQFSDSFRHIMNKVLNKIYHKQTFFKIRKKNQTNSMDKIFKNKEDKSISQKQIFDQKKVLLKRRMNNTFIEQNKLKIKGIGRLQNQSNLLKKNSQPKVYNKTSISFLNNKQHRKSIQHKRAKSLSAQISNPKILQNQQLFQGTFFNSRVPIKQNGKYTLGHQPLNGLCYVPRITLNEDYEKIYGLFKQMQEPNHKKIELNKKIYLKKMKQRQKFIEKQSPKQKQVKQFIKIGKRPQKQYEKQYFQPWIMGQNQFNEQLFLRSKRYN